MFTALPLLEDSPASSYQIDLMPPKAANACHPPVTLTLRSAGAKGTRDSPAGSGNQQEPPPSIKLAGTCGCDARARRKARGITLKLPDHITYRDTFHCDTEKNPHNLNAHPLRIARVCACIGNNTRVCLILRLNLGS